MLPEYQGPKLKGVAVTSRLFNGMKFGALHLADIVAHAEDHDSGYV